jgi:8-oxo-dGTP pyrophosphatase MutT (NUDIX family)
MLSYAKHDELVDLHRPEGGAPDHVLVIAVHDRATILVRNRARERWELPGGLLEPGDDPGTRAAIEFFEETGQRGSDIRPCAMASIRDALTGRIRQGQVFVCTVRALAPFRANPETLGIALWRDERSDEIDRAAMSIIEGCRELVDAPR